MTRLSDWRKNRKWLPAGRLGVEVVVREVLVVVVVAGKAWQKIATAKVLAEAVSRRVESYGDAVSEVLGVYEAKSVVCVESWEACEVASVGWKSVGCGRWWLLSPVWVWPWILHWLNVGDSRGSSQNAIASKVTAAQWHQRGAAAAESLCYLYPWNEIMKW